MLLGGAGPSPPLTWGTFFHQAGLSLILIVAAIFFIVCGGEKKRAGSRRGGMEHALGCICLALVLIGDFALFIAVLTKQAAP